MSSACLDLADLRSDLIDGALGPADRERVVAHLLQCEPCRRDVTELRAVRELLARQRSDGAAPSHLSDQLVSIAGEARADPLSTRAFGPRQPTAFPSHRRRAQRRSAVALLTGGMVLSLVVLVGWVAAPAVELAAVPEPLEDTRAEFGAVLGDVSVSGATAAALMLVDAHPSVASEAAVAAPPGWGAGTVVDAGAAAGLLRGVARAEGSVSVVGHQHVVVPVKAGLSAATVDVDAQPGLGTRLSLLDQAGTSLTSTWAPPTSSQVVELLASGYDLLGRRGATVAGRPATVVQAGRQGRVVERWWIDDASGVLLWQETYGPVGTLLSATGFTAVRIRPAGPGPVSAGLRVAAPPQNPPVQAGLGAVMSVGAATGLASSGWACSEQLAGMDLLQLTGDTVPDPATVFAVYGDGVRTVGVLQQRGRLLGAPSGAAWDDTLQVWRHGGVVPSATWQSGDTVVTVTTTGPASLLPAAVTALPRRDPVTTTTLGRVRDGWSKILADLKG